MTLGEVVARTTEFFKGRDIATARLDAELLVGEAVGMDRLHVYLNFDRPMAEPELERARAMVRRRGMREPVAYILGRREFRSLDFEVTPAVLIPRPETELLVEHAKAELEGRFPGAKGAWRVLEFGAGSGAVCVSLAAETPLARVVATEVCPDALAVARRNAERHGVSDRVEFRNQSDFAAIAGPFHAVLANPPYIDPADRAILPPDVAGHEPDTALFAADGGFACMRQILRDAPALVDPRGFVLMEIGMGMETRAGEIGAGFGWTLEKVIPDYAGIGRFTLFVRGK